jgi:hypothetical protein
VSSRESKLLAGNRSIAQVMWQTAPDLCLCAIKGTPGQLELRCLCVLF